MIDKPPFLSALQVCQGAGRLGHELRDFRDRVLPRLVDEEGPQAEAFAWAATFMGDNAERLAWSLAGGLLPSAFEEPAESVPTWDRVREAVRAAGETQVPSARLNLLGRSTIDAEDLAACRWDGQRVTWSLSAMVAPWPAEVLDERARQIAAWLKVDACSADELRQRRRSLPLKRLLRAFARMPRDTFYLLAESLVRIDPEVPDAILLVPTGRGGMAASAELAPDSAGVTGPVSHLLGTAMEVRANNHFGRVWRTALRPETRGSWRVFMPGQVLEILYRKWLVLHFLADRGYHYPFLR